MQLRGKWVVKRDIPTRTISCWGEKEAQGLIKTEIEYTADSFRWKDKVTNHPGISITIVGTEQFEREYSGGGTNDSHVDFHELGIKAPQATRIRLTHEAADITGATIEIPGDEVLIRDPNTIVFAVCNVYFEAKRLPIQHANSK